MRIAFIPLKVLIHHPTPSDNPISCHGKPVERTKGIGVDDDDLQSVDMSMRQHHGHCAFETNKQTSKKKSLVHSLNKFVSPRTGGSSGFF